MTVQALCYQWLNKTTSYLKYRLLTPTTSLVIKSVNKDNDIHLAIILMSTTRPVNIGIYPQYCYTANDWLTDSHVTYDCAIWRGFR